jgi:hypothetical protein
VRRPGGAGAATLRRQKETNVTKKQETARARNWGLFVTAGALAVLSELSQQTDALYEDPAVTEALLKAVKQIRFAQATMKEVLGRTA